MSNRWPQWHRDTPDRPAAPLAQAFTPPYPPGTAGDGPLSRLRARSRVVPFLARDEVGVLTDWATAADAGDRPADRPGDRPGVRVAVVEGAGGCGKTRLAAEVAARLADDGWHTGFLEDAGRSDVVDQVVGVGAPVLVVVDSAEAVDTGALVDMVGRLATRRAGTVLLLVARTSIGWWDALAGGLRSIDAAVSVRAPMTLSPRHPEPEALFQAAYRELAGTDPAGPGAVDPAGHGAVGAGSGWSTLDLVLLAWIAATAGPRLPANRADLYDMIVTDELAHWTRAVAARPGEPAAPAEQSLRTAAACVSVLAPTERHLTEVLAAVDRTQRTGDTPETIAGFLAALLGEPDGTLRLRPDPIADHLTLTTLSADPDLAAACVASVNRAGTSADGACVDGGPGADRARAERLCDNLARAAGCSHNDAERLVEAATALGNLGTRLMEAGRPEEAVVPAEEAVGLYRRLVNGDPAAFLPGLAGSLNNLGVLLSEAARRVEAVEPVAEAAGLYQRLADGDPAAFLPGLAGSLNNLGVMLAEAGHRDAALSPAEEATGLYRRLVDSDPTAYLPDLAGSLDDLATMLAEAGRHDDALAAFERAWGGLAAGPLVELMVTRARWRAADGDADGQAADLRAAVETAGAEDDPARGARARRIVRGALTTTGIELPDALRDAPAWANCELPDEVIDFVERAAAIPTWEQTADLLRSPEAAALLTPRAGTVRAAMSALFADQPAIIKVLRVLDAAEQRGLDEVLDELLAGERHALLLRGWLTTSSWADSRRYLDEHPQLLDDPRTLATLDAGEHPRLRQQAAMVRLITELHLSHDEVYDIVADVDHATAAIMAAVETADRERIITTVQAAPHLSQRPFAVVYAAAVLAVWNDDPDRAVEAARDAAANAGADDRDAGIQQLLRLVARQPQHGPALRELADLLAEAPEPASAAPGGD